jgi:holin-like protein
VAGMLLLFALLCSGIVPVRLFQRSSALLARHLPFFFVPIAVGLMNLGETLLSQGWVLLLVLVASAAVGLCVTGWLAQLLSRLKAKP